MRSGKGHGKEAATRSASSLGKLMNSVHNNAATSIATSRSHLNGPDQVLPATEYVTSRRNGTVNLRKDENGLGAEEPMSIPSLLQELSEAYPECIAIKQKRTIGSEDDKADPGWKSWTYSKLYDEIQSVARAFIETGLHRHHSVDIFGANSPEWVISNMAAIVAGGISVGIHPGLGSDEVAKIALDSKADIIVVEREAQLKKVLLVQHKLPELRAIIMVNGEPPISDKRRLLRLNNKHIFSWSEFMEIGQNLPDTRLLERMRKIAINQCCTITYTSGTHSLPKGAMFSHDNLVWSAKMALGFIRAPGFNRNPIAGEETLLSYLPLSHISTQIIDVYYTFSVVGTLAFPNQNILFDAERFFSYIKEVKPTIIHGPPMIFERIYHRLSEMRRGTSGVQRFFLDWSNQAVSEKNSDRSSSGSPSRSGSGNVIGDLHHKLAKNTICKKYKENLGLSVGAVYLCRGGALPDRILRFLSGFDIVVHCSYGQSESTSFVTSNIPKRFCKFSTVGKAVTGVRVKLESVGEEERFPTCSTTDNRGEVRAFGRNIFMGYLNKENESRELIGQDGFLKMGDRAFLDAEGFMVLLGTQKDQLKLNNGVVLDPSTIEAMIRIELPCVSHCIVVTDGNRLGTLLTLDTCIDDSGLPTNQLTAHTQAWFRAARFDVKLVPDVIDNLENGLKHVIQAGIDRANQEATSACEMIVEWRVLSQNFSYNTGEVGSSCKIRRSAVTEKYANIINVMFTSTDQERRYSFDTVDPQLAQQQQQMLHEPYSHQLSQIVEEEESARNSVDKEIVGGDSNNNRPHPTLPINRTEVVAKEDDQSDSDSEKEGGTETILAVAQVTGMSEDSGDRKASVESNTSTNTVVSVESGAMADSEDTDKITSEEVDSNAERDDKEVIMCEEIESKSGSRQNSMKHIFSGVNKIKISRK